jgi:hypothetical protein
MLNLQLTIYDMLTLKKNLILVEAKKIEFKGQDNESVEKIKYTFLTKEGSLIEGFEDAPGTYMKDVQEVDSWDETKAKKYPFRASLFHGETKYTLLPKGEKEKKSIFDK